MKKLWILVLLVYLTSGLYISVKAQKTALEIIKASEEKMRGKSLKAKISMQIIRPKWKRSVGFKIWTKGEEYSLILITAPTRDKGQGFLKREREMWNWQPRINRTIKMPPSLMGQSWMGSDFKNDDLVKESSLVKDYTHKVLGKEKVSGRTCYKIQLIPKDEAPVVWGKVLLWISQENFLQLKTEQYDEDGYLVNTLIAKNIQNMGGRIIPTQLEMIPEDEEGYKTILNYESMTFDSEISSSFFSLQSLKKLK